MKRTNLMRKAVAYDFMRTIRSWGLYTAIAIVVVSAIITYSRNYNLKNLTNLSTIGLLNTFIYSNIVGNNIVVLLAPVIAGLAFSTTIVDDMKTGIYRQLAYRLSPPIYLKSKIISSSIWGGGVFLISYLLIFIVIAFYDPNSSTRTEFYRNALFGWAYDRSLLLYCLLFIGYSCIFGMIYSLVCMGVAMVSKNKYIAVGAPFFIYYASTYIHYLLPANETKILCYFIPRLTFDITQGIITPYMYIGQLIFALATASLLITIGKNSIYKNGLL